MAKQSLFWDSFRTTTQWHDGAGRKFYGYGKKRQSFGEPRPQAEVLRQLGQG